MISKKLTVQDIWDIYGKHLRSVEAQMMKDFASPVPEISTVGGYIVAGGGKRLRPLLVALGAEISGYEGDEVRILGSIIETIHTASLLHDDIVDGAEVRRGKPAAHSVWGNSVIVLVGDFLYANALRIAVSLKNQPIMEALSEATTRMTEAEILQLSRIADPNITEEDYLAIVQGKTAALMSAACRAGAILGKRPADEEEALARFGMKLGMIFQIADDLLDYRASEEKLGKSLGKDLEEGKITLPVIYLLREASPQDVGRVKEIVQADTLEQGDLEHLMNLFARYHILESSTRRAEEILVQTKSELHGFPPSRARDALLAIADHALYREK